MFARSPRLTTPGGLGKLTATVRSVAGEEFDRVVGYELGEKPFYREPGWDDDAGAGETVASTAVPTGRQVDDADDIPF